MLFTNSTLKYCIFLELQKHLIAVEMGFISCSLVFFENTVQNNTVYSSSGILVEYSNVLPSAFRSFGFNLCNFHVVLEIMLFEGFSL